MYCYIEKSFGEMIDDVFNNPGGSQNFKGAAAESFQHQHKDSVEKPVTFSDTEKDFPDAQMLAELHQNIETIPFPTMEAI